MRLWWTSCLFGLLTLGGCNLFTPVQKSGCQVAGDCKAGEVCLNHQCKNANAARCGAEALCTGDSDCPSGACSDGCCLKACAVTGDCPFPLECTAGACRPPEQFGCSANEDCTSPSSPHCDTTTNICVACLTDSQCPPDGTCTSHACVYPMDTGCDTNSDCKDPLLPRCLTSSRTCVSCLASSDCPQDPNAMTCNQNTHACELVRTTCGTDSDCTNPAKPHCRVGDGVCVECTIPQQCLNYPAHTCFALNTCGPVGGCGSDADCTNDSLPFCDPSSQKCVQCLDNSACSPGFGCAPNHTCQASSGCTSNANCRKPTPVCHAASGICVGCLTNANCGTDGTCTNNVCVYPPPPVCSRDADCGTGAVCAAAIYPHDETQAGNLCVTKEPGATYGPGRACTSDSQCKSGLCLEGGVYGYCQGGCTADSDCQSPSGTPGGGTCTKINLYWTDSANEEHVTQVPSCVIQCEAELDCYPAGTCRLAPNITNDRWVARCEPTPRSFTSWGGTLCTSVSDCGGGSCIKPSGTSKGYCAGLCGGSQGVANCAPYVSFLNNTYVPTCPPQGVMLPIPNGGASKPANICWGPSCSTHSDCPTEIAIPPVQWKCVADPLGPNGSTTAKFCHPP